MKNLFFALTCAICLIVSSCSKREDCGCNPVDPIDSTAVNYAIRFNGENQYLHVPYGERIAFDPNGSFTIEAWVNPADVIGYHAIIVKGNIDNIS
ncbi:MAG TPA: hypothetical protein VEC36_12350, partial [Patescibacteria group bacterium]|nr:hypothetical protein [Patescibacteria group bacterium]